MNEEKKETVNKNLNTKKNTYTNMQQEDTSQVVFVGETKEVIPVGYYDYNDFSKQSKRNQNMEGFDEKYRDFVDYIMKITHEIWEEKGIGIIYDTYHNNVTMHLGTMNLVGVKDVVSNTLQTLHAFPDRRLIGQNVIWSGDSKNGFLSSHRVMSTATNLGDSNFGPATGKKINFRTVIECATINNRIYEEWLVRDNLWIVIQLGFDAKELAKKMAKGMPEHIVSSRFGLCEAMEGQFVPKKYLAKDNSVGEMLLEMTSKIYNCKLINEVKNYYHNNAVVHYICNKDLNGFDEIQGMLVSFMASMSSGSYEVERITVNENQHYENSYDCAIRWRYRGLHDGIGYFGSPSFKSLDIMGISHFLVVNGKVKEEWVTFDGLDVLKQTFIGDKEE